MKKKTSQHKNLKRVARHNRIRAKVSGTATRPRLAVFRSNRYVYAQLINDEAGATVAAVDSRKVAGDTLTLRAQGVGAEIAKKAKAAGITEVVFDRGGFRYQGAVAALATGAREGGLGF
jgi:large subunit ribosomal protein L18